MYIGVIQIIVVNIGVIQISVVSIGVIKNSVVNICVLHISVKKRRCDTVCIIQISEVKITPTE